jgi:hypothetical protein
VDRWENKYTTRLDRDLTKAWPELVNRLQQGIDQLSWSDLTFGPGAGFKQKQIDPRVSLWYQLNVEPVVTEAREELRQIVQVDLEKLPQPPAVEAPGDGALNVIDIARSLTLPGGLLVGGGALAAGITTATSWIFWTVVVVNWPLLIGGLVVGTALCCFGVYSLTNLKADLRALPKAARAPVRGRRPRQGLLVQRPAPAFFEGHADCPNPAGG